MKNKNIYLYNSCVITHQHGHEYGLQFSENLEKKYPAKYMRLRPIGWIADGLVKRKILKN